MPEGAIYVGRPTRWGNPFWHMEKFHGVEAALDFYRTMIVGGWSPSLLDKWNVVNEQIPYHAQNVWRNRMGVHPMDRIHELRGHDLACWCRLDQPCHADILLELVN
jgi:hypothetical protein